MKTYPTLYDKSSTGSIKVWNIKVLQLSDHTGQIVTTFGKLGGTQQTQTKHVTVGKNVGKKNETTAYIQAVLEAESTWKKKKDKGYVEQLSVLHSRGSDELKLPMLAHNFRDRAHDIVYPAAEQPKFNGVRCLIECDINGCIIYWSRKGKKYDTLQHLSPALSSVMKPGDVLDGEVYVHDWTFQEITKAVKKFRPEVTTKLELHLFDLPSDRDYNERALELLNLVNAINHPQILFCPTTKIESAADVKAAHDRHVQAGYEGVIIRNLAGGYTYRDRSANLQKYKEFIDEEFKIVGGYEGTGTDAGCVVFTVANPHGKTPEAMTFNVRPRGTVAQRQLWFKNLQSLIGQSLTVRYQNLSDDGVPIFPVGIDVRDYE